MYCYCYLLLNSKVSNTTIIPMCDMLAFAVPSLGRGEGDNSDRRQEFVQALEKKKTEIVVSVSTSDQKVESLLYFKGKKKQALPGKGFIIQRASVFPDCSRDNTASQQAAKQSAQANLLRLHSAYTRHQQQRQRPPPSCIRRC